MERKRTSGILLHISQLPSPYGIGTLGKEAFEFVDFLAECKVGIWQMLPLTVTSYGDSPYQAPSSVGLNYYFIDFRILEQKGLLSNEEYSSLDLGSDPSRVDYGKMFNVKVNALKKAFSRFDTSDPSFIAFEQEGKYRDFAFFMTMKSLYQHKPWYEWPEEVRTYSSEIESGVLNENKETYLFYIWTQYEFLSEFSQLKKYANDKGILLMGDMPLYLAYDSVESYKYSDMLQFDKEKHCPTVVAGCPPDYFCAEGQLWGNPIYDWEKMKKDDYKWFSERINYNLSLFDILRIDHFRGFSSYYSIPFGAKNAVKGKWVKGPGMDLFRDKADLSIVAEDLGDIDDDVRKLLKDSGYPGMKVLSFAFDGKEENNHKPSVGSSNSVCYTGTHDNTPVRALVEEMNKKELAVFRKDLEEECKEFKVAPYLGTPRDITLTCCTLCYASPSVYAIIPMHDLLACTKEARINMPAYLSDRNWTYRFKPGYIEQNLKIFVKRNVKKYKR